MMSNTGTNFYQRFGDRLPTREIKSRRGRMNVGSAIQATRGTSLGQSKNFDTKQAKKAFQETNYSKYNSKNPKVLSCSPREIMSTYKQQANYQTNPLSKKYTRKT